ncbi:hypothetical protein D9757_014885 [Collybiopsis confluens]|uniref:Uncharacterized protein n=1 Tax=Collybiopsis confluens TaxID=2823264 RepID=A0A8H5CPY6_9AGAR|nr:hypothetical protein D9757_014885 [Collybiopsis confluens]
MKLFLVVLLVASVMAAPLSKDTKHASPSVSTAVLSRGKSADTLTASRGASATASGLPKAPTLSVSSKEKKGKFTSVKGSSTAKASGPAATASTISKGNSAKASGKNVTTPSTPATAENATSSAAAENNAAKGSAVTGSSAKNSTYSATSGSSSNSTCDPSAAPSSDQVANAIRDWLTNVATVNTFLENVASDSSDAATVFSFASNEPKDLAVLGRLCGLSNQYNEAVQDLQTVFQQVLTNLQDIIHGGEALIAGKNINQVRCCNVLPDLDVLWLQAAEAEGLVGEVNTSVPRPSTCAAVTCS